MAEELDWLQRLASRLGEPSPEREEIGTILRTSREVARGVERRLAPLTSYVAGMHVARRVSEGADRAQALREVEEVIAALVPEGAGMGDGGDGSGGGRRRGGGVRRFGRRRTR
jgi:hypothetical protein